MRLLVCGSRSWPYRQLIQHVIENWCSQNPVTKTIEKVDLIIHGGAVGADVLAGEVARELNIPTEVYLPDWKANGKRAGFIRNQRMLNEGRPDCVLACWDGWSRGTLDMMSRARKANIPVNWLHLDGLLTSWEIVQGKSA